MGGGAWPFLVGGVICMVNTVNERDRTLPHCAKSDSHLITSQMETCVSIAGKSEAISRSVLPLDVLDWTRATLMHSTGL